MLVEFTLAINGNRVYVNPANVNCVYGDRDSEAKAYIEMAGYSEDQGLKVLGTPAEVAARLKKLTAASPGCMIVHALEEAADLTEYLLAEAERRADAIRKLMAMVSDMEAQGYWPMMHRANAVIDLLGGEAALAKYDEILGGGTVAENATVAPDPRDEALRVAEEKLLLARGMFHTYATHHRLKGDVGKYEKNTDLGNQMDAALAAIRGAR